MQAKFLFVAVSSLLLAACATPPSATGTAATATTAAPTQSAPRQAQTGTLLGARAGAPLPPDVKNIDASSVKGMGNGGVVVNP